MLRDFVTGARKNRDMFDTSRTSLAPLITLFWLMLQREKMNCSVPLFKGFRSFVFFPIQKCTFSPLSQPSGRKDEPISVD